VKVLFFDCETTGLDPVKNDIIQLAGIVEIDGKIKDEFNFFSQPFNYDNISPEALEVHGISIDTIKQFPKPQLLKNRLINILSQYVNKYDQNDKFFPAGQNVRFDIDFLSENFKKNQDKYFGSWLWRYPLDLYSLSTALRYKGILKTENLKLETLAKHFNVELKAHDAMSDIRCTREIIRIILDRYITNPGGDENA
jgi:DNA polymerase-3 subunit epsilon